MPYKNPEKRRACVREAVARHKAAAIGKPGGKPRPLPALAELRFGTARDVLALVNGEVEALLADERLDTVSRARTVGFLAGLLLRAVETGELEERLEKLEGALEANANGHESRQAGCSGSCRAARTIAP